MTGFEPRTSGFCNQPLYQLSHNHCPKFILEKLYSKTRDQPHLIVAPIKVLLIYLLFYPPSFDKCKILSFSASVFPTD